MVLLVLKLNIKIKFLLDLNVKWEKVNYYWDERTVMH